MALKSPSFGAVAMANPRKRKKLLIPVGQVPPSDSKQKFAVRIIILPNSLGGLGPEPRNSAFNGLGIMGALD